jgi:hypothetical protein
MGWRGGHGSIKQFLSRRSAGDCILWGIRAVLVRPLVKCRSWMREDVGVVSHRGHEPRGRSCGFRLATVRGELSQETFLLWDFPTSAHPCPRNILSFAVGESSVQCSQQRQQTIYIMEEKQYLRNIIKSPG